MFNYNWYLRNYELVWPMEAIVKIGLSCHLAHKGAVTDTVRLVRPSDVQGNNAIDIVMSV